MTKPDPKYLPTPDGLLLCSRCGEHKSTDHFSKKSSYTSRGKTYSNPRGYDQWCRSCNAEYHQERVAADPLLVEKHKQSSREAARRYKEQTGRYFGQGTDKVKARVMVSDRLHRGLLTKPESCSRCGKTTIKLHAHHHDYSKPLDVEWLCIPCHRQEHKNQKEAV